MAYSFTTIGAIAGLVIAIILIIKKVHPAYSLIVGALIGGLIGGGGLTTTVNTMVSGASGMMSSVLRILTSGILAGALIKTGSAEKIAETIVEKLGEKRAIAAVAIATMIICAVGVFVDISVITVAPIAIAIGRKAHLSKAGISIDPLIALPVGGLISIIVTGKIKEVISITEYGLSKVVGVSILLIGTGTLAGIIKASVLQYDMINLLEILNMPTFVLAPVSGILMAAATASTTSGATIASQTFADTLISAGIPAINSAAMIHAGSTVIDSLPHGSFFHATGGAVSMEIKERMKLIPFEALVGLTSTVVSVIIYLI